MNKISKKKSEKIGILGGTFDPPHIGHLHISKIALKKLKLNSLIWVITKKNPLKKKPYLNTNTRVQLSKDITKDHNGYFTLIKVEEDMKAAADIFTIDPIKYKISEKIKKSFDPKRILNPGKMYTGI